MSSIATASLTETINTICRANGMHEYLYVRSVDRDTAVAVDATRGPNCLVPEEFSASVWCRTDERGWYIVTPATEWYDNEEAAEATAMAILGQMVIED